MHKPEQIHKAATWKQLVYSLITMNLFHMGCWGCGMKIKNNAVKCCTGTCAPAVLKAHVAGACLPIPIFLANSLIFSECKALTITLHVYVVCRKKLDALPPNMHHFNVLTNDLTTLQGWSHHLHLEENIDFQPCPCTHIALLSVLGRCVGSFWHVLDFYVSTEKQRWSSREVVLSDFIFETGKCGRQVTAPLNSFLQMSLQDIWEKVGGCRGSLERQIHRSPKSRRFSSFIPNLPLLF